MPLESRPPNIVNGAAKRCEPRLDLRCIESDRTYTKFTDMLIIADDLKVPLHFSLIHVQAALFGSAPPYPKDGYFDSRRFENIGVLGIFGSSSSGAGLEYGSSSTRTRTPYRRLGYRSRYWKSRGDGRRGEDAAGEHLPGAPEQPVTW
jgi:hypothetical protein